MIDGARVAVVVPAHNEARLVARTLRGIPPYVDHVVVVDDASTDATVREARSVGDPRVELARHPTNRGVGAAITTGYRRAFASGAEVAAVMAGDGQMDPDDLDAVLGPVLRREADYVKGDRLSHPDAFAAMPMSRWIGNHGLSAMNRLATGLAVHDSQCGYTAMSRAAFSQLDVDAIWPRYGYPNDLLSRLAVAGLRVRDVVVRPVYGDERSGIRPRDLVVAFPWVLAASLVRRVHVSLRPPRSAPERSAPDATRSPVSLRV